MSFWNICQILLISNIYLFCDKIFPPKMQYFKKAQFASKICIGRGIFLRKIADYIWKVFPIFLKQHKSPFHLTQLILNRNLTVQ